MCRLNLNLTMVLLLGIIEGCARIEPCGTFSFSGSEVDTTSENGIDASLSFDFDPADCTAECTCNLIPYVQIVRTWSFETSQPLYPTSEKRDRATTAGYYIDRVPDRKWGYYGRNDDGSFASYLTPGSNTTTAVLGDAPRRPEASPWLDIWWQASSAPVCIESSASCFNDFCGYYFWSWLVDDAGTVTGIVDLVGWEFLSDQFNEAVAQWNAQAPGLGKNNFPSFGRLPD
jgi:hypothetical protein